MQTKPAFGGRGAQRGAPRTTQQLERLAGDAPSAARSYGNWLTVTVALYGRHTRHRRSSCAASEIIGDRHAMPRALSEPAACARGKRRVLLETSAHSLPSLDSRLFPWGFFRGFGFVPHVRHSGMRLGRVRGAHGGFPAAPAPVPCSRGRGASLGARRGVGFRLGGFFLTSGPSRDRDCRAVTAFRTFRGASSGVRFAVTVRKVNCVSSNRPLYRDSVLACNTCQIIQLRSVRVHSRFAIALSVSEDAHMLNARNSHPLSKSARVAATVVDSQRTSRHAEVGTARAPP